MVSDARIKAMRIDHVMRHLRAAVLVSIIARVAGGCSGVRVIPLASDGYEKFSAVQYKNLTDAFSFNRALAFRIVTGFDISTWNDISIVSDLGDDAAAWSCALTDGAGEFENFSGIGKSVLLPSGSYSLTCDFIRAPKSSRMPVFSSKIQNMAWTACAEFGAVPTCVLARQSQPWAEFGDSLTSSLMFTASVIAGTARMAALDVSVMSAQGSILRSNEMYFELINLRCLIPFTPHVITGCNVTVSVEASASKWLRVGAATSNTFGVSTVTVPFDTLVSVTPLGTGVLVEADGCQMTVASADPNTAVGDGAYGVFSDTALVGSIRSIHPCAKATSTGRSIEVVTPTSTTAVVVRGWDPSTVARARVNLFARTTAQPRYGRTHL